MSDTYSTKTRNLISTLFTLILTFLLLFYLVYIEFFQDNRDQVSAANLLRNPISNSTLKNTVSLRLKNRIGSYSIKKEKTKWILQDPLVQARQETIDLIIKALKDIKIYTVHEYEPINFESFNMHEPLIEIDLYTKLLEKYNIKIGRMNYLNNTTYMTVSGSDHIFQTDLLKGSLETLGLSDFIDSRIFSPEIKNIKKFQVFKENQKTPSLQFVQTEKNWTLRNYGRASSKKIQDKILTILNIKAHKIVDKIDEDVANFIENYLKNPIYVIKVELNNGEKIEYKISSLTKELPELKLEKRQYFLIRASNNRYTYIIDKTYLNELQIRKKDLKP